MRGRSALKLFRDMGEWILPREFGLGRAALLLFLGVHLFFLRPLLGLSHFPFDYDLYHFPLLKEVFEQLQGGRFPLWNPHEYCGAPLISNPQAAVFYPVHHLLFWPLIWMGKGFGQQAMQLLGPFHFAFGATGVFFFLRRLELPARSALLGGVFFALSGWLLAQTQHLGLVETIAWMPWAYAFALGTVRGRGLREPALLALCLGASFHAGFLPEFATMGLFLGLYVLALLGKAREGAWGALKRLGLAALLFLGLSLPLLLPILQDLGTGPPLSFHQGLYPEALETLLAPQALRHMGSLGRFLGRGDPSSSYLYPGFLALLFLGSAFGLRRPFFSLALVLALLFGISPWANLFLKPLHGIPVLGSLFRGESFVTQGAFFASVLAAMGFARGVPRERLARRALLFAGLLLLMVPLTLGLGAPSHWEKILLWIPVFLGAFFVLTRLKRPLPLLVVLGILDLVGTGSLLEFVQYPGPPRTVKNVVKSPWFRELKGRMAGEAGPWRVLADQSAMGGIWMGAYPCLGMESLQGFQPQRHEAYFQLASRDLATWKTDRLFFGMQARNDFFRKTNLRWLLLGEHSKEVTGPWKRVGRFGPVRLYELPGAQGRFFLLPARRLGRKKGVPHYPRPLGAVREVRLERVGEAALGGRVDAGGEASVLHLGMVAYPGWRAWVDGEEAALVALDGVFLGLPLPAGEHRVELRYWPRGFGWCLGLGGGALLGALFLASGGFFGSRGARGRRGPPAAR
ncbi:MAG TPA: hypothetical protein ENK02_04995 [Planctomycetes bacterium]|nr:hypothetical protein [Planctomycetota bacterium]